MSSQDDDMESLGRRFDAFFSMALAGMEQSLFDLESRCLRPLYRIEVNEDAVTAIFDLPNVKKKDVKLTSTEDSLKVDASMSKPTTLRVGGLHHAPVEFARYSRKISLPVRVDPSKASARFANGILLVRLPRVHAGKVVRIR